MVGAKPFKLLPKLFAAYKGEEASLAVNIPVRTTNGNAALQLTSASPFGPNTTKATTPTTIASGAPTPNIDDTVVCNVDIKLSNKQPGCEGLAVECAIPFYGNDTRRSGFD